MPENQQPQRQPGQPIPHGTPHALARAQILSHGRDRYPTVQSQCLKVAAELGELAGEIQKHEYFGQGKGSTADIFVPYSGNYRIRRELADTALALFELANKLGINIIDTMQAMVTADERKFTPYTPGKDSNAATVSDD
jgi:NTP pyrophosphatase (non-canonical NTP hydrolase)